MEIVSGAVAVDEKELQFLQLRKKLKEHFREELKKESGGSVLNGSEEKKKLPYDKYGSFFGHSQPSIARRVIMEREGMLEVWQSPTLRLMNSPPSKPTPALLPRRIEANKLKALRDYSSLLSDDAENLASVSATMGNANPKHPRSDKQGALSSSITNKKARVMQNKLQSSSKLQAYDVHKKASLSKPQSVTRQQPEQEMEHHDPKKANVMQSKFQSCSRQHKDHNETKASGPNLQSSTKQQTRQGKVLPKANKEKVTSTQKISLSKQQIKRSVHNPGYDDEVEMSYISSLCQSLFRRNHTKQVKDDYDFSDDCKVSSFSDILAEERNSAKIARKEDQTELLRIEREEREEKLRRKAKKQKLQQN